MRILLSLLLLIFTACSPIVTIHKMGNEYVQDAHSRNWWGPNWQRVTYCWKLENGFCPKEDTRVETANAIGLESPGQKMATGFVGNAPIGLGFGMGLAYMQAARMTQSVTSNGFGSAQISTVNTNPTVIKQTW